MQYKIMVNANTSHESVEQIDEVTLKVCVTKPAVDGKANKAVEKVLKKYFNKSVKIIKGYNSKTKIIEI